MKLPGAPPAVTQASSLSRKAGFQPADPFYRDFSDIVVPDDPETPNTYIGSLEGYLTNQAGKPELPCLT